MSLINHKVSRPVVASRISPELLNGQNHQEVKGIEVPKNYLQLANQREVMELSTLLVDNAYQRGKERNIQKIVDNFDPLVCLDLVIGIRPDGTHWIMDGQQRWWALRQLDITHWNCVWMLSTGRSFEAKKFNLLNGAGNKAATKKLTGMQLFKALLCADDDIAVQTLDAVQRSGMDIYMAGPEQKRKGWPFIKSHNTLYTLTETYGPESVYEGCRLLVDCWEGQKEAIGHVFIDSCIQIVAQCKNLDRDYFVDKVGEQSAASIVLTTLKTKVKAKPEDYESGDVGWDRVKSVTRTILTSYNKGLNKKDRLSLTSYSAYARKNRPTKG